MIRIIGFWLFIAGFVLGFINLFLLDTTVASTSALMQLENSDVIYGIGAKLATANIKSFLEYGTVVCVVAGIVLMLKPWRS